MCDVHLTFLKTFLFLHILKTKFFVKKYYFIFRIAITSYVVLFSNRTFFLILQIHNGLFKEVKTLQQVVNIYIFFQKLNFVLS